MVAGMKESCKPVCNRWQYDPMVGYSEMRSRFGPTADLDPDTSWSRITVSISNPYYEEYTEKAKESFYIVFCSIGGVVDVYIGASVITLIEIVYYSIHCCCILKMKRKLRRVGFYES